MFGSRRQRGKKRRALRLFFATDIHGSDVCFRKFLAAAKVYEADALILGAFIDGRETYRISDLSGLLSSEMRLTPPCEAT